MKKKLLLSAESLTYSNWIKNISAFKNYLIVIPESLYELLCDNKFKERYQTLLEAIKNNHIEYTFTNYYNSIDYLIHNEYEEIYISYTNSSTRYASDLVNNGIENKGKVYLLQGINETINEPIFQLVNTISIFSLKHGYNPHLPSFEQRENPYNKRISYGFRSHYIRKNQVIGSGNESIIINSKNSKELLKIYTRKLVDKEDDKLEKLCDINDSNLLLPKDLIYDRKGNIIGITMKKIKNAVDVNFDYPNFDVLNILNQLYILSIYEIYHPDFNHNIIVNDEGSYIIDIDSANFRCFKNFIRNESDIRYVPSKYKNYPERYYNATQTGYDALILTLIRFGYIDVFKIENQSIKYDSNILNKMKMNHPSIYALFKKAYIDEEVVFIEEIIMNIKYLTQPTFHNLNDYDHIEDDTSDNHIDTTGEDYIPESEQKISDKIKEFLTGDSNTSLIKILFSFVLIIILFLLIYLL